MMLTLNVSCLRPALTVKKGESKPALALADLPAHSRQVLGLSGLNIPTDLLAGSDRKALATLRDRGDKAGCSFLILIEPEPQSLADRKEAVAQAAAQRMRKVIEAAHVLGCSAAVFSLAAPSDDELIEAMAEHIRSVIETAGRRDVNLLFAPTQGLTAQPEVLTELLKKIGGFRVGTFPSFGQASSQKDPLGYLRRLAPYATSIAATTMSFEEPTPAAKPPKPKRKAAAPKKGKKAAGTPEAGAEGGEDDLGLPSELIEAIMAEEQQDRAPEHSPYSLDEYVAALSSVGYDGTLAIDYQGEGDITMGILNSRRALQQAVENAAPSPAAELSKIIKLP